MAKLEVRIIEAATAPGEEERQAKIAWLERRLRRLREAREVDHAGADLGLDGEAQDAR
jgi:hypothetical protein